MNRNSCATSPASFVLWSLFRTVLRSKRGLVIHGRVPFLIVIVAATVSLNVGCSAVKIETGQTREEAVESSRERSSLVRSQWAQQVNAADPVGKVELLIGHVEATMERYFGFADEIKYQWQQAEDGRGQQVSSDEMRKMIEAWSVTQRPVLDANDDNLEYARRQALASNYFGPEFKERLDGLCDRYYDAYSSIFYPSGTLAAYSDGLLRAERELDRQIELTQDALASYR